MSKENVLYLYGHPPSPSGGKGSWNGTTAVDKSFSLFVQPNQNSLRSFVRSFVRPTSYADCCCIFDDLVQTGWRLKSTCVG